MARSGSGDTTKTAPGYTGLGRNMSGSEYQELLGAVVMMLRSTMRNPVTTLKAFNKIAAENAEILMGRSERDADPKDRRFTDSSWQENPFFKRGMQSYLATHQHLNDWASQLQLSELEHAHAKFIVGMIMDAIAPTNSLAGNPAAVKRALETGGASLVKGLQNAYNDIVENGGLPSQVDKTPFTVGENLATSEGAVVYKNELLELIQYQPITDQVHHHPMLFVPPQINKYYAVDLTPANSMIQFLLAKGIQPFMISWRNPTKEHAGWGMSEYVDGVVQASEVVRRIAGSEKVNVVGACSGGITAATFASLLGSAGDERIGSLTFLVCVLSPQKDDSEVAQLASPQTLELARLYSRRRGILKGDDLARMFAWMRPNDLVWNYVVNNYLMGEDPPPFDILYWNNDTTNLPAQLHSDYLNLGLQQPFANPGAVELAGHLADLSKVNCDSFIVAGITDHITPWKACYRTTALLGSKNLEFILSSSGHLQALINPPGNPKARYFQSTQTPEDPDEWLAGAEEIQQSWWPLWAEWLQERSGVLVSAPTQCGSAVFPALSPAPGEYVFDA